MCAKDDLIGRKGPLSTSTQTRLAGELATAESITAKDPNHVDTFSSDFAFSFANILSLIAFIISHRLFADELLVYVTIRNLSRKARRRRSTPSTLLARFIPITKIRNPLLKTLENAAKSEILLACADRRTRQCYLTICAILANYEEQVLLTSIKKNRYCTRYTRCLNKGHNNFVHLVDCFGWKHHNFNIHVSLATDTLHLLLKGLVIKMLDFMQDITEQKAIIQQLIAVISPLFVSKAPFALHFIRAVCDLVTLAQYKSHDKDTLAYIQGALERMNVFKEEFRHALTHIIQDIRMYRALDSICTRANSEAHHITIVKQFYSMTNKKEYILQICLHNSQRTALLAANHATVLIPGIQPHSTKLPLSEVAANIAISDFTHAAAVRISIQIHPSIKCWQSSGKRHNNPKHCNEEVHRDNRRQSRTVTDSRVVAQLHLILTIIDYTCYDKDGKYIAYIEAFSKVLLFNNNRQINNTTRMLSVPFKFYDLSTIIRLVHLVLRDLPNSTTRTTMSYYVNNYIN
ncbi:hypothetical protein HBH50_153390 [Parastagonospora nodorum]|nr:hypothetical protein HBH50_153390 [Parastagonospora nodorum]KAH4079540.1 hypothetical protein HBH48_220180 [Parastagonospora nodorum]